MRRDGETTRRAGAAILQTVAASCRLLFCGSSRGGSCHSTRPSTLTILSGRLTASGVFNPMSIGNVCQEVHAGIDRCVPDYAATLVIFDHLNQSVEFLLGQVNAVTFRHIAFFFIPIGGT